MDLNELARILKPIVVKWIQEFGASGVGATGTIHSDSGTIAGWTINPDRIAANTGTATLYSNGRLELGNGNNVVIVDPNRTDWRLWAGSLSPDSASFRVSPTGALFSISGQIGGWSIDTTTLSAGSVFLDSSQPSIRLGSATAYGTGVGIWMGNDAGTYKFRVGDPAGDRMTWDGSTLLVTGTLNATTGQIGGWGIGSDRLSSTNIALISGAAARLEVGTGTTAGGVAAGSAGTDVILWAGNSYTGRASAPFRVTASGDLVASSASITGTIYANSGTLSGLTVTGLLTVGSSTPTIQIDGTNKWIQSSNYAAGTSGWRISSDGTAEFGNIRVRGFLETAVLSYQKITAAGGRVLISRAAGRLRSDVTLSSTSFTVDVDDDPSFSHAVNVGFWGTGHLIWMQTALSDGSTLSVLGEIASVTDMTTFTRLSVNYVAGATSGTIPAGSAIANLGARGTDNYIDLLAGAQGRISIVSLESGTGDTRVERARMGRVDGYAGLSYTGTGFIAGDASQYMVYTPASGLIVKGEVRADAGYLGNLNISGVLTIDAAGGIFQGTGTFASPNTGLKIYNSGGIGLLEMWGGGAKQVYMGSDGKLYAGGGKITLSSTGFLIRTYINTPSTTNAVTWALDTGEYVSIISGGVVSNNRYLSIECGKSLSSFWNNGAANILLQTFANYSATYDWESTIEMVTQKVDSAGVTFNGGRMGVTASANPKRGYGWVRGLQYGTDNYRRINLPTNYFLRGHSALQAVPSGTVTYLNFDTLLESWNTDNTITWNSTYPGFQVVHPGVYWVSASIRWVDANNNRVAVNAWQWIAFAIFNSSGSFLRWGPANLDLNVSSYGLAVSGFVWLRGVEIVRVAVYQQSGGTVYARMYLSNNPTLNHFAIVGPL